MDIEWKKIKRVITGKASEQEKREVDAWKKGSEQREGFYEDAVSYYGRIPEKINASVNFSLLPSITCKCFR